MYLIIEKFLSEEKNCIEDYVGNELHMGLGRKMRTDVYGVSKSKEVYLLEGKLELEGRINFSKVLCEAMPLLDFADYVYIFGTLKDDDFKLRNKKYFDVCKLLGIGIIRISKDSAPKIILEAQQNDPDYKLKKESIFRIFFKDIDSPISNLIFQACYEFIKIKNDGDNCVTFNEIYENLFPNEKSFKALKKVLRNHSLNKKGMRREFQNKFAKSDMVEITRMNTVYEDYFCLTELGMKKGKESILLDYKLGD